MAGGLQKKTGLKKTGGKVEKKWIPPKKTSRNLTNVPKTGTLPKEKIHLTSIGFQGSTVSLRGTYCFL